MKTFTKHILLLALMLFGVAGAAWALPRAPQKFTAGDNVDLRQLQVGDTLTEGVILNNNTESWDALELAANRYRMGGTIPAVSQGVLVPTIGENGLIVYQSNNYTPVAENGDDGNAWIVMSIDDASYSSHHWKVVHVGGIYIAPDPYAPALDETTGHWNFLMPGSNKVVKAVLYDSIVLGPHVELYDADPAFAAGDIYTRGDSTIYYYDTNNHHSFYLRADEQAGGKYFGYWADLDPTDYYYTDRTYRRVSTGSFTCGQRFTAAYLNNYTLTLVTPQGGGTLSLDGETPGETTYNISIDGNTNTNVSFPFQTTVFLHDGLEWVDAIDQSPLSVSRDGNNAVITISEPYDGDRTITYQYFYDDEPWGGAQNHLLHGRSGRTHYALRHQQDR